VAGISARQLAELRRPCFLQGNMDLEFLTAADWGSCFARNKELAVETLVGKGNQSTKKMVGSDSTSKKNGGNYSVAKLD